jgi:putative oxidoreductase
VDARFEVGSCGGRIVNTASSEASEGATKRAANDGGSKGLRIGLWVVQVLLALVFAMSGGMKLAVPYEELLKQGPWVQSVPAGLVKFIGVAELSGALGLILPAATRIRPFLTPLAAAGFVVIMVLASALHLSLGQPPIAQVILAGLAAFVVWGRFRKAPITPRG